MPDLLWAVLVGMVSGWVTGLFVQAPGLAILRDTILGMLGASAGARLFQAFGGAQVGMAGILVTAIVGAVIALALAHFVNRT